MIKSKQRGDSESEQQRPPQSQSDQPGVQSKMEPQPRTLRNDYKGSEKLAEKVALITGGDSGIGRSVAVMLAREGADVAVVYLCEKDDAEKTKSLVEAEGRTCLLIKGDVSDSAFCESAVQKTVAKFGRLDVLINNAPEQHPTEDIENISDKQLIATFSTNVYSMFYLARAAVPHLKKQGGGSIINTTSVIAYRGSPGLADYSATQGAIVSFTRSLSQNLIEDGIRVNAVAPGPIWTPQILATFDEKKVSQFGSDSPMGRAGQPNECASCILPLVTAMKL